MRNRTGKICIAAVVCFLAAAAYAQAPASRQPPWTGMWSGRGITTEKLMDDAVRKLSRTSSTDFWFVIDADRNVKGEAFVTYAADLKAMKWKVPVPNMGTIDAEVAGSSGKIIKRIGIRGTLNETPGRDHGGEHRDCNFTLALQAMGHDQAGQLSPEVKGVVPGADFEFKIEANVNVPAGAGGISVNPGAQPGVRVLSIPGKGWSPFQSLVPKVERGPGEPMRATAESTGEKHYILWYAVQQSAR